MTCVGDDWLEYQQELFGGGDLVEAAEDGIFSRVEAVQDNNSNAFTDCL